MMQQQAATTDLIYDYIQSLGDKKKLRSLVPLPELHPTLQLPTEPEPSAKQRYLEYKRIYGRRRGG